jgi:hypothetical protein
MRDLPVIELGDHVRAGHPEQLRSLLRGELRPRRHQGHSVTVRHLPEDLHRQLERLALLLSATVAEVPLKDRAGLW